MSDQYNTLLKQLEAKKFKPVYLLHGDEAFYIDRLTSFFEERVLAEEEKAFNLTIMYGKDIDQKQVVDSARRYPMMAPYNVVIVKEAQAMRDFNSLEQYVSNPSPDTLLVLAYKHGKADTRRKTVQEIKKKGVLFESKKVYENKLPAWIVEYLQQQGYTISPKNALLIAGYLGNSLSKLANELDKLIINLEKGAKISAADIQNNIGISITYNVFEFQDALGQKNREKAYKILDYFIANPKSNPLVVITATLYQYFSKVYLLQFIPRATDREIQQELSLPFPSFVRKFRSASRNFSKDKLSQIFEILHRVDLRSKGVDAVKLQYGDLLKEMTYKILS